MIQHDDTSNDQPTCNDITRKARLQAQARSEERYPRREGVPPSMEETLEREVDRTAAAHEQALLDLRRWRMSHDHSEGDGKSEGKGGNQYAKEDSSIAPTSQPEEQPEEQEQEQEKPAGSVYLTRGLISFDGGNGGDWRPCEPHPRGQFRRPLPR